MVLLVFVDDSCVVCWMKCSIILFWWCHCWRGVINITVIPVSAGLKESHLISRQYFSTNVWNLIYTGVPLKRSPPSFDLFLCLYFYYQYFGLEIPTAGRCDDTFVDQALMLVTSKTIIMLPVSSFLEMCALIMLWWWF